MSDAERRWMEVSPATTAICGATALVGPALEPVPDSVVLIEDEAIRWVGPSRLAEVPATAERVDVPGRVVAPGFIDAHVHIGFADPSRVVAGGITTVRDLGWPPGEIHPWAWRSRERTFEGPEIVPAGPILTAPGGYPTRAAWAPSGTGREVDGVEDARAQVDATVNEGASVVKVALNPPVGPTFEPDVLRAVVQRAHEHGRRVTGHVFGLDQLDNALDAGMDELAHMLMSDETIPERTLKRMADANMTVVPTLSIRFGHDRATAVRNLAHFREAGGRVIYGTDLGNEGPRPGIDPLEVTAMAEAGYSPIEIARSATSEAAEMLGLQDRGVLASGKLADIVMFEGPLRDAADLTRIAGVWRRGRRV